MRNMLRRDKKKAPETEAPSKSDVKAEAAATPAKESEPKAISDPPVAKQAADPDQPPAPRKESRKMAIGTIEAGPMAAQSVAFVKPNKYHAIDDRELEYLMKFEKPLSLFVASIFAGLFFGTVYPALGAFARLSSSQGGSTTDIVFLVICAVSFGVAIASSFVTLRSKTKISEAMEKIRQRSKLYLPPDHPGVPPQSVGG